MNETEIAAKIVCLNSSMVVGQPIAMGSAFFDACAGRGMVSMDIRPRGANPKYRGLSAIVFPAGLSAWEFQIENPVVDLADMSA